MLKTKKQRLVVGISSVAAVLLLAGVGARGAGKLVTYVLYDDIANGYYPPATPPATPTTTPALPACNSHGSDGRGHGSHSGCNRGNGSNNNGSNNNGSNNNGSNHH